MGAQKSRVDMRKSFFVFPALAIVVSVGCASVSGAQSTVPMKKSTTTTVAKKKKKAATVGGGKVGIVDRGIDGAKNAKHREKFKVVS